MKIKVVTMFFVMFFLSGCLEVTPNPDFYSGNNPGTTVTYYSHFSYGSVRHWPNYYVSGGRYYQLPFGVPDKRKYNCFYSHINYKRELVCD